MKIKARVNAMAASTKVWPTIGCWVGRWCWVAVLLFWVIVGQGPAVLAFFLSSILSSFVFSLSPRTRLDLTTMLSTGPLTRL